MPECSPSRASMFTGRCPLRTNIQAVIVSNVLANSQVSPFEITAPKLLKSKGARYDSAMFGKFHLAGPDNNPFGNRRAAVDRLRLLLRMYRRRALSDRQLRRTCAGPQDGAGPYAVRLVRGNGPGVCRYAGGACERSPGLVPGLSASPRAACSTRAARCGVTALARSRFRRRQRRIMCRRSSSTMPRRKRRAGALSDPRTRGYRTTLEVNAASDWIQQRDSQNAVDGDGEFLGRARSVPAAAALVRRPGIPTAQPRLHDRRGNARPQQPDDRSDGPRSSAACSSSSASPTACRTAISSTTRRRPTP